LRSGSIPADPLVGVRLREFGLRLRRGSMSAEEVTGAYIKRIKTEDLKIGSFAEVADSGAISAARGLDALLQSGTDLGPLMGVPVAIKEIFACDGLPFGAGTQMDVTDLRPRQGAFVDRLRRAGCVLLGTTRTTEFAAATINSVRQMPWNPVDRKEKRVCGGSSHGSAAALRAGFCTFAIGSDTGGSVRLPAALCGVFGFKSTVGVWPTSGVFQLSPTLDSIGLFTRCAEDAAIIFSVLSDEPLLEPPRPTALRLAVPTNYVFEDLDAEVSNAFNNAIEKIKSGGADVFHLELQDIDDVMSAFGTIVFGEFVCLIGQERLERAKYLIDPVPWSRIQLGFGMKAETLETARRIHFEACAKSADALKGIDGILYPTAPMLPCRLSEVQTSEAASSWNLRAGRLTRLANAFGQCGVSIPLASQNGLPVGLQVVANPRADARLLALSRTLEAIIHNQSENLN
jgi:aspartyl-tRNA(Asn)/glutamyl-tRNA(Gln) amidotransferase subunit A